MLANSEQCVKKFVRSNTTKVKIGDDEDVFMTVEELPSLSTACGLTTPVSRITDKFREHTRSIGAYPPSVSCNRKQWSSSDVERSPIAHSTSSIKGWDVKSMMTPEAAKLYDNAEIVDGERLFYCDPTSSPFVSCPQGEIEAARWFSSNIAYDLAMRNSSGVPSRLVIKTIAQAGGVIPLTSSVVSHMAESMEDGVTDFKEFEVTKSLKAASASPIAIAAPVVLHVDESRREVGNLMRVEQRLMDSIRGSLTMFRKRQVRDERLIGRAGPKIAEALQDAGVELNFPKVLDLCSGPGSSLVELGGKTPTAVVCELGPLDRKLAAEFKGRVVVTNLEYPGVVQKVVEQVMKPGCSEYPELLGPVSFDGGVLSSKITATGPAPDGEPFDLVIGDGAVSQALASNRTAAEWELANMRLVLAQWALALSTVRAGGTTVVKMFGPQTAMSHWLLISLSRCGSLKLIKPSSSRASNEEFYAVLRGCTNALPLAALLLRLLDARGGSFERMWTVRDEALTNHLNDGPVAGILGFSGMVSSRQSVTLDVMRTAALIAIKNGFNHETAAQTFVTILSKYLDIPGFEDKKLPKEKMIMKVIETPEWAAQMQKVTHLNALLNPPGSLPQLLIPEGTQVIGARQVLDAETGKGAGWVRTVYEQRGKNDPSILDKIPEEEINRMFPAVATAKQRANLQLSEMSESVRVGLKVSLLTILRREAKWVAAGTLGPQIGFNKPVVVGLCNELVASGELEKQNANYRAIKKQKK